MTTPIPAPPVPDPLDGLSYAVCFTRDRLDLIREQVIDQVLGEVLADMLDEVRDVLADLLGPFLPGPLLGTHPVDPTVDGVRYLPRYSDSSPLRTTVEVDSIRGPVTVESWHWPPGYPRPEPRCTAPWLPGALGSSPRTEPLGDRQRLPEPGRPVLRLVTGPRGDQA